MARLLLAHGADANASNPEGNTLLHMVALAGKEENLPLAGLLLARGARVNRRNGEGRTPLGLLFRPGRGVLRPGVSARLVALLRRHGGVR
jgi:ankyrin repeat protein